MRSTRPSSALRRASASLVAVMVTVACTTMAPQGDELDTSRHPRPIVYDVSVVEADQDPNIHSGPAATPHTGRLVEPRRIRLNAYRVADVGADAEWQESATDSTGARLTLTLAGGIAGRPSAVAELRRDGRILLTRRVDWLRRGDLWVPAQITLTFFAPDGTSRQAILRVDPETGQVLTPTTGVANMTAEGPCFLKFLAVFTGTVTAAIECTEPVLGLRCFSDVVMTAALIDDFIRNCIRTGGA